MNVLINLNETYVLSEKNKAIIAQNGLYIHVFLKGLKIYHNFCVMLRLCTLSLDKSFRPPEKKEGTDVKKLRNDVYRLQLEQESPDVREI